MIENPEFEDGRKLSQLKASEFIRVARDDLLTCERSKKYHINMYRWHEPDLKILDGKQREVCSVCFAGSVLANTNQIDHKFDVDYLIRTEDDNYFPIKNRSLRRKIQGLDMLRCDHIEEFLYDFYGQTKGEAVIEKVLEVWGGDIFHRISVDDYSPYELNRKKFLKYIDICANILEEAGY